MMIGLSCLCLAFWGSAPAPHFETEIIPVLTKAGCNAGACHGAAAGRGGFHLSLFGGDPATDYDAIVHAFEGRRVNLARPLESLVLLKPTGQMKHGGSVVLDEAGPGASRIREWIAAGAPRGGPRKLSSFVVSCDRSLIDSAHTEATLRALARFDDGPEVDVTRWTVFTPADATAVTIDDSDRTTARVLRRGQHDLIARFLDRVEAIRITFPLSEKPVDLSGEEAKGLIDEEILATLARLRIPVSPQADDSSYLRRIRLDLTGTLPTPAETQAFVRDSSKDKSAALVDRLLASAEFAEFWTLRLARLLRISSFPNKKEEVRVYTAWLENALHDNVPLDRWARALLTATGDSQRIGPANFARMVADAREEAELVSRVFLGSRLQCANCHNHPLDRWTQDDYHGLAAIFAKLDRSQVVSVGAHGGVTNPRTGEPAVPRLPGTRNLDASSDTIRGFSDWLSEPDNPYFARAQVNRIWKLLFGRGLVEPVDDMRQTNPASHPRLLERLAEDFVRHGYDLRHTIRQIAQSRAYGRSGTAVPGNESDDRFYARAYRRDLEPEVLTDAIVAVTEIAQLYDGLPAGTRAITLYDSQPRITPLDTLGRCSRSTSCEESAAGGGLPAKLLLLNSDFLNAKIAAKDGLLARLVAAKKTNREIVAEFYGRALGRAPTTKEMVHWLSRLEEAGAQARAACLEDFVWGLLNSREFTTNH
jgi:hypothetical protein